MQGKESVLILVLNRPTLRVHFRCPGLFGYLLICLLVSDSAECFHAVPEDSDVVEEQYACEDADDCDYANKFYEVETLL